MSDVYKVFYETDHPIVIDREFTKEQLDKFLNSLTYAEKSNLKVTKIKSREEDSFEK